jgi:predicted polyphosphate/ATP-dependent NAD kinase
MAALAAALPGAGVIAAPGAMGAQVLAGLDLAVEVLEGAASGETEPADTRRAAAALSARGVAALLFAGGDGTARDLTDTLGLDTPMLGIPCGVKMHSGVFATSPEAAGRLAADLLRAGNARVGLRRVEIMDIDEDAARAGRIAARLYGYARAPHAGSLLQGSKAGPRPSDEAMLAGACAEIARELAPDVLYLIGPGTGAKGVLTALGLEGTLLGVDAVRDGRLVGRDLSEADALTLAGDGPIGVIVGITGGQGFVFGRGNQQIGPDAIRRAGRERLIIVAGAAKLAALPAARLLVDTGDAALDAALAGHVRVRTGPRQAMLMRLST